MGNRQAVARRAAAGGSDTEGQDPPAPASSERAPHDAADRPSGAEPGDDEDADRVEAFIAPIDIPDPRTKITAVARMLHLRRVTSGNRSNSNTSLKTPEIRTPDVGMTPELPRSIGQLMDVTDDELPDAIRASVEEAIRQRIKEEEEKEQDGLSRSNSGFHSARALLTGADGLALADPPKNIFGPGHALSPEVYGEFHKTQKTDGYMLAYNSLEADERMSCFETLVYFQSKIGYLIRQCNHLCTVERITELFEGIALVTATVLEASHCCIYEYDESTRKMIVVFDNEAGSLNNGLVLPSLGTFAGVALRQRTAVFSNRGGNGDARFASWQYKQMCKNRRVKPGAKETGVQTQNAIAVPLYTFGASTPTHVIEASNRSDGPWDASHVFILNTLAEYAGPAFAGVWRRMADHSLKALPQLLNTYPSAHALTVGVRDFLCDLFNCEDCEVYYRTGWQGWMDDVSVTSRRKVSKDSLWRWINRQHSERTRQEPHGTLQHGSLAKRDAAGLKRTDSRPTIGEIQNDLSVKDYAMSFLPDKDKSLAHMLAGRSRDEGKPLTVRVDPPADKHPSFSAQHDHAEEMPSKPTSLLVATLFGLPIPAERERQRADAKPELFAVLQLRNRRWSSASKGAPSTFGPLDVALFQRLAVLLGSTLRQGLVAERSRFLAVCTAAAEARTAAVTSLSQATAAHMPLPDLFAFVTAQAVRLMRCERATMWLVDRERQVMYSFEPPKEEKGAAARALGAKLRQAAGIKDEPTVTEMPLSATSLAGACIESGRIISLADAYADDRFNRKLDQLNARGRTRSLMCVPIHDKKFQQTQGCLQCVNKMDRYGEFKGSTFTELDKELAISCANLVAVAIVSSRARTTKDRMRDTAIRTSAAASASREPGAPSPLAPPPVVHAQSSAAIVPPSTRPADAPGTLRQGAAAVAEAGRETRVSGSLPQSPAQARQSRSSRGEPNRQTHDSALASRLQLSGGGR